MESIIIGTPVCTTCVSGMNEILDNGKYGLITDNNKDSLYEGIESLINDKSKLQMYRNLIQKRSEIFDINESVKKVQNLFLSLVD